MDPTGLVNAQLYALLAGDYPTAYALNSAANQTRFGSAATFEHVVRGSAQFRLLTEAGRTTELTPVPGAEGSVAVTVVSGGATGNFVFDLVRDAKVGWCTDGVRIEC